MSQPTSSQSHSVFSKFELLDQNKVVLIKGDCALGGQEHGVFYAKTDEGAYIADKAKWVRGHAPNGALLEMELSLVNFCDCSDPRFDFAVRGVPKTQPQAWVKIV